MKRKKSLLKINQEIIDQVPSSVVSLFRVFPLEAGYKVSIESKRQHYVKLLCLTDLTEEQKETIYFMVNRRLLEFVTPNHS